MAIFCFCCLFYWFSLTIRLRVVLHFSSGIVERAKRERVWKSPHTRKGVSLALLSLRKNGGLLVVYTPWARWINTRSLLVKGATFVLYVLGRREKPIKIIKLYLLILKYKHLNNKIILGHRKTTSQLPVKIKLQKCVWISVCLTTVR